VHLLTPTNSAPHWMPLGWRYGRRGDEKRFLFPRSYGVLDYLHRFHDLPMGSHMTLRQFLFDNFGWDIYDWADDEIRF
jgi:hypothetical protein